MENNFLVDLIGSLQKSKSQKQINSDLKELEKVINKLKVVATFSRAATKKELNAYITQLSNQLSTVKLKAKIDNKNLKSQINSTLNGMSFKDIDALNVDENKTKLKVQKVIADVKSYVDKTPIMVNVEFKKDKLSNDLTTYLNKNTKINESSVLLEEADKVKTLINAIDDRKSLREATDAFELFKSEVAATGFNTKSTTDKIKDMFAHLTKIGSAFGLASMSMNSFVKSLKTLRSNDTILTEISKTSELTKKQLKELGDEAFRVASKYGQISSNYLLAVQEMARSGYEDLSKELGELSLLAQSAGDMTAENANNYLLATDAAYKYSGSVEKLNAALDGANYISNKNSASLTDIADATRVSASFASNAGVAIDELTAAEATMIATTKRSGSEIGRAFRSIILNLQQVSGEFDGEVIDEEQLKKVEARCHSLGVELEYMKDGIATLRNPMDVLRDLAEVYNSLPDNSAEKQGLISDLGGKYHANSLSALLGRWDLYEKMLDEFAQGTGSALEEAEKTANSWEGRLQSLQNSFDSFYNSLTNKDVVMGGITFFDKLIQGAETLTNTIGEIPLVLTAVSSAMVSMNKNYGITSMKNKETGEFEIQGNALGIDFTAIKNMKNHFQEAEKAISIWNDTILNQENDLESFNNEVVQNNAQLKAYLATCSQDAPASLEGYKNYLNAAGVSTDTLRLKTILLNAALAMGIGIAIQVAIKGIDALTLTAEEAQEKVDTLTSKCESLKSELDSLKSKDELTSTEQQRLSYLESQLTLQQQLLDIESRRLAQARNSGSGIFGLSTNKDFSESGSYNDLDYKDNGLFNKLFNLNAKNNLVSGFNNQMHLADTWLARFDEKGLSDSGKETVQTAYDAAFEKITDYYATALEKASEYKLAMNQIQSDIESGALIKGSNAYKETLNHLDEFTDGYMKMMNIIGQYESHTGNGNSILNSLSDNIKDFDTVKEELTSAAESGFLTSDYLNKNGHNDIVAYLDNGKVSIEQFCEYLLSAKETVEDVTGAISNIPSTFDFASNEEAIDNIQSTLSSLRSALESLNKGELSENKVLDLMQEFPALVPYIDLTADGFGNLSEGLRKLIEQQPDALIESLEKLKGTLETEEEHRQVELLIDSLQRLSSYGDSGIEAYAATIGNTWSDTENVIEGVTTQFGNLAKVQEAVADGLTMSATAAAELAKMYPEILNYAQVTANGQIALNEDVVSNILGGDKRIVNGQIAKLEADKSILIAKQQAAEAELNIIQQVGMGQGKISEAAARQQIENIEAQLEADINAMNQQNKVFAGTIEDMSTNEEQFDNYTGEVANAIALNMGEAAFKMAKAMSTNSVAAQISLAGIIKKATDAASAVQGIKSGTAISADPDAIYATGGGTFGEGIKKAKAPKKYTANAREFTAGNVTVDEFKTSLELDISEYQKAISNIDSQIEMLKNLQLTFDTNGGIGGHGYADKIKELEAQKDALDNAAKDSAGSAIEQFQKTVDLFKQRTEVLTNAFELLEKGMNNVFGADAKNTLLSAQIGILDEEINNYTDALAMYRQKANEALSGLDSDLQDKIVNGAVQITDFIGDGNEAVVEAMESYQGWADEVNGCTQKLEELNTQIRQLELDKFNNIVEDFTNQFDIHGDSIDLIKKQIGLLEEAGQLIGESFYTQQIEQSQKQLSVLETEKARLTQQLNDSLSSGRVKQGTDEWLEMQNALTDVEGDILDCKTAIEGFNNELLELNWKVFDRVQTEFGNIGSELDNLAGLFDDFNDIRVSDGKGTWTDQAIATLGLYAQQYELAQYQVGQYGDAINKLKEDYLAGRYSATEYMDKLAELSSEQWDAVNSTKSLENAIYKLNETRINEEIDTIEDQISAYKESTDAKIQALDAAKKLHDYEQEISERTKSITNLERQIAAMRNDNTAATIAKRKKLEEQLSEEKNSLIDYEYQHSIETQKDALDKNYEAFEEERNKEIDTLKLTLENKELLISNSLDIVKNNTNIVGEQIAITAQQHGIIVSDAIISAWRSGENAIASYGAVLTGQSSAFIGNIIGVQNYVYGLQTQANSTANSLSYMFGIRADNLVNSLVSSYYSESNLNAMTQTLKGSLINTLERGYNVSSITNALSSIASGANSVANAANNAANALSRMNALQQNQSVQSSTHTGTGSNNKGGSGSNLLHKENNKFNTIKGFARGGIVKKDNDSPYNEIAESIGEDSLVAVRYGEGVLTPEQTDALVRLAPSFVDMGKPWNMNGIGEAYKMPEFTRTERPNVTLHYDSLLTVNGDVNDTNHFIAQVGKIAQDRVNKTLNEINRNFRRGR